MPITPQYTWSETENDISITINGVPVKDQGQLLCSDCVLKVNVAPYLLLLDLFDTVAEDQSKATIKGGSVHFHLTKVPLPTQPTMCMPLLSTPLPLTRADLLLHADQTWDLGSADR